jgi:pantetheine-phosphate adenylyltransferase
LTNKIFFDTKLDNPGERAQTVYMKKKAVYPGSFDPITNGHVDIIQRGLEIFDNILVAVLENPKKKSLFATKERVAMIQEIFADYENVQVKAFHGLLVDFAKAHDAKMIIRGLRAISDFEYEFQMVLMNRKLDPDIETLFMMPSVNYSFLSSRLVKEVCMLGGCLEGLVPPGVEKKLKKKYQAAV